MLRRAGVLAVTAVLVAGAGLPAAWAAPSPPGNGAQCPPGSLDCDVHAGGSSPVQSKPPPKHSGGSKNPGTRTCLIGGTDPVPCYRDGLGWFNAADNCYWLLMDPQPAPDDPLRTTANGYPGDAEAARGKFYNASCPDYGGRNNALAGGTHWRATPPPGYGGGPDVQALAQQAVTRMRLLGADVGIAPSPGSKGGSVGFPVWVWNQPGPRTTGPASATATAMGVTVTATARVQDVAWDFGNDITVDCAFPGTAYQASFGAQAPQAAKGQCGFPGYGRPGMYEVRATTTWAVHWVGGGQQGDLTTTRTSQVQIRIGEVQVVGQ